MTKSTKLAGTACLLAILLAWTAPARAENEMFGTWWRGFGREAPAGMSAAKLKEECPWIKGVFIAYTWSRLEQEPGEYDWQYFDGRMTEYARAGYYIQFMVWVGPDSPRWIYENGVPEVKTTPSLNPYGKPHRWTYPFYLDPDYERYYHRMLRDVAARLDRLPADVREKVICVQTAEGTTGDEGGYKGAPLDKRYALPEARWGEFKYRTWRLFDELYRDKKPKVHLLINSGNQGQYHDWIMENMPDTWRKAGNPGHGYQLNNEMDMIRFLDPVINRRNANGEFIRCRSEMDEMFKGWFREAPVWNMYWLNLWGLHFGLDIFQHNTEAFLDRRHEEGFRFYSFYGGEKDPATSPGAWCALRDGLDAANTERFPIAEFGPGMLDPRGPAKEQAVSRTVAIADSLAAYGARQGDAEKGSMLIMQNRDAKAMNDVGWNIWAGNYERYLTQYDPNATSQGYWRVGDIEQPYGRFARGFDAAAGKNAMYFDLNDRFYPSEAEGPRRVSVRVVYYDKGQGTWELIYDDGSPQGKSALAISNRNSGRWIAVEAAIDDGRFANGCPHSTDLVLRNTSSEDTLFHMIELRRR